MTTGYGTAPHPPAPDQFQDSPAPLTPHLGRRRRQPLSPDFDLHNVYISFVFLSLWLFVLIIPSFDCVMVTVKHSAG